MVRRRRYQDDDRFRHCTEAAMLEQVCGVEGVLADLGDGWWQVGIVMGVIAGVELEVLANPVLPPRPKRRFLRVSEWNREYEQWREPSPRRELTETPRAGSKSGPRLMHLGKCKDG